METIDPVWFFGGIALLCGILIGALAQRHLNSASGDVDRLKAELDRSRAEMDEYQASVNRHFNKTSDLVSELTQDYVRVYQHLAEGAETLANNPEFARALEQSQGRVLISVEKDEDRSAPAAGVIDSVVTEPARAGDAGDAGDAAEQRGEHSAAMQDTDDTAHTPADSTPGEAEDEAQPRRESAAGDAAGAPLDSTEAGAAVDTEAQVESAADVVPPRKA